MSISGKICLVTAGGHLNIKMLSYQYRDLSTVLSFTWESPYLGKMVFVLRWDPGLHSIIWWCHKMKIPSVLQAPLCKESTADQQFPNNVKLPWFTFHLLEEAAEQTVWLLVFSCYIPAMRRLNCTTYFTTQPPRLKSCNIVLIPQPLSHVWYIRSR